MLALEGITKIFQAGTDRVAAIQGIDLSLEKNDFLTVIGSNGAGKSTLLNLIAGVARPTQGRIRVDGADVTCVPAHLRARQIGRIVQDPLAGTAPSLTVVENLSLATKRGRRTLRPALPRSVRRRFHERLAALDIGLEDRMDTPVSLLSGGERQALTVMMATLARPQILLLDEHTAALDPRNAEMILGLTSAFVDRMEMTTMMVTHNMDQAIQTGNRLIMLHKGKVIHQLEGQEKQATTVKRLVDLFASHHVADDELLLGRAG